MTNPPIVQSAVLTGAVLTTGLVAGLFFSYAISVMPALAGADDRTFVDTMQRINVAILNGWFGAAFGGALLLGVAAVVVHLPASGHRALPWLVVGVALYVAMLVVTGAVNIPLNDALAAMPIDGPGLAEARQRFEQRWVPWNVIRAVLSSGSFGCLVLGLLVSRGLR